MKIRCAKCGKRREGDVCPACGAAYVYINVYFQAKHWKFWRSPQDGQPLDYMRATKQLIKMEESLLNKEKLFNPFDWMPAQVKKLKLGSQMLVWLQSKKDEVKRKELSPGTIKDYAGYVKNYFSKSFIAKKDVREVDYKELREFRDALPNSIKIKTRRNILNALHSFFRWMRKERIILSMPEFPSIEGEDAEVRIALTIGEQDEGLQKIPMPHRDVIEFGCEAGLRPGETCSLKIGDINLSKQSMPVQRTWAGSVIRETTKGKNKIEIPISDRAFQIAKHWIKGRFDKELFLFINPETGRPYRVKKLNQLWKQYSGLQCTHYEASRHSFCTQLSEMEGVNIKEAQRLMRHKSLTSTLKYVHTKPKRLQDIVNRRSNNVISIRTSTERVNGVSL